MQSCTAVLVRLSSSCWCDCLVPQEEEVESTPAWMAQHGAGYNVLAFWTEASCKDSFVVAARATALAPGQTCTCSLIRSIRLMAVASSPAVCQRQNASSPPLDIAAPVQPSPVTLTFIEDRIGSDAVTFRVLNAAINSLDWQNSTINCICVVFMVPHDTRRGLGRKVPRFFKV